MARITRSKVSVLDAPPWTSIVAVTLFSALSRRAYREADILQLPAGDTEPEGIAA